MSMGKLCRCRCIVFILIALSLLLVSWVMAAWWAYQVIDSGTLYLTHARGPVTIFREVDTRILHIEADNWESVIYGQGFATAQQRLWQMEKMRRMGTGTLSELFGKDALLIDEFMRYVGLAHISRAVIDLGNMPEKEMRYLSAFADGVNDYVQGVSLFDEEKTARLLPPEFYVFGITKENFKPWTPADSILTIKLMSLNVCWNWAADLQREAFRQSHPDLAALLEEVMPFSTDYLYDMVPIVDDEDLKANDSYSDELLVDKYRRASETVKKASPPLSESHQEKQISQKLADYLKNRDQLLGGDVPLFGHQMASDNWVIHGNHTETGMPLFANDPQLASNLPIPWILWNLKLSDGRSYAGAQIPGNIGVGLGRTNNFSMGLTVSRVDTSDLWQEKLNADETQYFVDGEWRDLEISTEIIKVKGADDVQIDIKKTHRGPIIPYEHLQINSSLLFGGQAPSVSHPGKYSFAWHGQWPYEQVISKLQPLQDYPDLPSLFDYVNSSEMDDYRGNGVNLLFADTKGNIGYLLIMSVPERKDKTPFIGSRVLDGTTSQFDWTGNVIPHRELPKSLNPSKGYLMTANGRQTSDHAKNDYGATQNSPGRTLRVDEMLRQGIAEGKKFTLSDMAEMQKDVIDIIARRVTPKIVKIMSEMAPLLSEPEQINLEKMLRVLRQWHGSFDMDSIGATIYTRWYIQFLRSLYMKYTSSEEDRMAYSDNYHFTDAFQRIVDSILEKKEDSQFQTICEGAYEAQYKGANHCAYSMTAAMIQTYDFLTAGVGQGPSDDWAWGKLHVQEYTNVPWSKTPLRPIYHRSRPASGNNNTPGFSKISETKNLDSTIISSTANGNLKINIQHAADPKDDVSLFSIDGGQNENPLQGNYFDYNVDHNEGKLKPMRWTKEKLDEVEVTRLEIRGLSEKTTKTENSKDKEDF